MTRRGGILLEVLLSLSLFVGAAGFALGATRSALSALERGREDALAADLARSRLAELESGLISIADFRGGTIDAVGSFDRLELSAEDQEPWSDEVATERTPFTGLVLATISVHPPDRPDGGVTLRQLIALRERDAGEYETDELLRGLPDGPEVEP